MDVKKLLESNRRIKEKIRVTLKEIEQMRLLAENVAAATDSPSVGRRILELDDRLNREYGNYVDFQKVIGAIVGTLDNESELIAVKSYYFLHETVEQIAKKMCYSERHISRLIKQGLEKLQEKYKDVEIDGIE